MLISELLNFANLIALKPDNGAGDGAGTNTPAANQDGDKTTDKNPDKTTDGPAVELDENGEPIIHHVSQKGMTNRLERARNEAVGETLQLLGVDNVDDLKAIVEAEKARRRGEMSELERTKTDLETVTTERDGWKTKYETLVASVQADKLERAITDAAQVLKTPADAIMWAGQYAPDDLAACMDEDGKIDDGKVKALISKIKKDRPDWIDPKGVGIPDNSDGKGAATADEIKRVNKIAVAQAKSFIS